MTVLIIPIIAPNVAAEPHAKAILFQWMGVNQCARAVFGARRTQCVGLVIKIMGYHHYRRETGSAEAFA